MAPPVYARGRLRVTRACDRCKKRKIRCSGVQPCERCISCNQPCAYNAPYARGQRVPQVSTVPDFDITQHTLNLDSAPTAAVSPQGSTLSKGTISPLIPASTRRPTCLPVELTLTDLDGHYLGPSSEAAFMLRVQRLLNPSESFSHISLPFSLADEQLPIIDPSLDCTVPDELASHLAQAFFEHAIPIGQFLHWPTVEAGLSDLQSPSFPRPEKALMYAMFTVAIPYMGSATYPIQTSTAQRYFATSESLLNEHHRPINLATIQARLCQCIWLLGESHFDKCWDLFGVAARQALAIGLHQLSCVSIFGSVDVESYRRTFWALYTLDNLLSITLGRPKVFNNLDIDQDLPSLGKESDDFEGGARLPNCTAPPAAALATVAYFRLSWITGKVLQNSYSRHPPSLTEQIDIAMNCSASLKGWREAFSSIISTENSTNEPLSPIVQLQADFLNLVHSHTIVLANRFLLLEKLAPDYETTTSADERRKIDTLVGECVTAAMDIITVFPDIDRMERIIGGHWVRCVAGPI
ncbi:fungal-specific transcription factor domain-containing protein [Aspergillus keveii]|uniref:Fungal-specific transcription factor domain-containing protein n=1 Tax=Aspergillus keveii TaxID=714993 RepID=A0ABR4G709_9EURO